MRHILVEIVCPKCNHHTHIKSHTWIQPELEPKEKERILHETMFTYTCPHCDEPITFIHNFLYHDPSRRFLIYMNSDRRVSDDLEAQFPTYTRITVSDPKQLKEAISLQEDGFDHDIMKQIKTQLMKQDKAVKNIRYHDYDADSDTIWLEYEYAQETICKAIARHVYDRFMQKTQAKGMKK